MSGDDASYLRRFSATASRLAAELAHSPNVRRAAVQLPYRLRLDVTDDGLCRTELKTIREFGWMVSGFTIRSNSVSVVRNGRADARTDGSGRPKRHGREYARQQARDHRAMEHRNHMRQGRSSAGRRL